MTRPDNPQFSGEEEKQAVIETAKSLNESFKAGGSVWEAETLRSIRSLPNPIVFDFNRVLVDSTRPWEPNPEAKEATAMAVTIGTVFVVTSAEGDWELRQQALEEFGLWHEGMVLMTSENYDNLDVNVVKEEAKKYIQLRGITDEYTKINLSKPHIAEKRLAPIFMKPFDIPIIDDSPGPTHNNPGMFGIQARDWTRGFRTYNAVADEKGLVRLSEAVEIVAKYYANVDPTSDTLIHERKSLPERPGQTNTVDLAITELEPSETEWNSIMDAFFADRYEGEMLESALLAINAPQFTKDGALINSVSDYNDYELTRFGSFAVLSLSRKFQEVLGRWPLEEEQELIWNRYVHMSLRDQPHFIATKAIANRKMIADAGWEEDLLGHLEVIYGLMQKSEDREEYYPAIAEKQLGWEYHFPKEKVSELKAAFDEQVAGKDIWDKEGAFMNFLLPIIYDHLESDFGDKLDEVKDKYGEDTAEILEMMLAFREFNIIFREE